MPTGDIAIVGAGFSGAVVARELARAGYTVTIFEARDHIAGNCHTFRDELTDVLVHAYGPHIFHTADEEVWAYVNQFSTFEPYVNRVKAVVQNKVYSLPINLHTINQFFGTCLSPVEARALIDTKADRTIASPVSFEDQAMRFVGSELYEAFFKGYTQKQWGVAPSELPADLLKRLPLRFNYDDNYFNHPHQGMPTHGYTRLVGNILDHDLITTHLSTSFSRDLVSDFHHTFYTGPLDGYFDYSLGVLGYRTLEFEAHRAEGDFQGNAVINYCDADTPWTRITEHKHFSPWEEREGTIYFKEFSRLFEVGDIPFYPIRLVSEKELLGKYVELAKQQANVSFIGRLGTYRYLDMDVTIREALDAAATFISHDRTETRQPNFFVNPL